MDNYIVKKFGGANGDHFYYKNGLLHREAGPAILSRFKRRSFLGLGDEALYKEEIFPGNGPSDYEFEIVTELRKNDEITESMTVAIYYLEGQPYSSNEFQEIKAKLDLKKELDIELTSSQNNSKKAKI